MDYEVITAEEADAYPVAPFLNYARARATDKEERDAVIGDAVHLWDGAACRAAIVGGLDEPLGEPPRADLVALWFDLEKGLHWGQALSISHNEAKDEMTWHWPCGGQ